MVDFTEVLTKPNGEKMQRAGEKTPEFIAAERELIQSGKSSHEMRMELEFLAAKYIGIVDLTLGYVAGEALQATLKGEENISGAERYDRRKLAKRVYENDQNMTKVELEKIKTLIEKAYDSRGDIVGAAFELLG